MAVRVSEKKEKLKQIKGVLPRTIAPALIEFTEEEKAKLGRTEQS